MAMKRINSGNSLLRERGILVLGGSQRAAYIAALQRNLIMPLFAWRTGHPGRTLVLDPYKRIKLSMEEAPQAWRLAGEFVTPYMIILWALYKLFTANNTAS
jgi:hypothetical protein